MGKEVLSAKKVYRESPFEISIPAYEYETTLYLTSTETNRLFYKVLLTYTLRIKTVI